MVKNKTAVFNNNIQFVFCFTEAQKPSTVQQVLIESLNYSLPPNGLTIDVHVPSGAANVYASYSIPTPSYLTADIMTSGSGNLTLYIPYQDSGTVFVSVLAKKPNTTFLIKTETGNADLPTLPEFPGLSRKNDAYPLPRVLVQNSRAPRAARVIARDGSAKVVTRFVRPAAWKAC